MFWRIKKGLNLSIVESDPKTTLFDMLKHKHWGEIGNKPNPDRKRLVFSWRSWKKHGLNDLHYKLLRIEYCSLFTRLIVDTFPPEFDKKIRRSKNNKKLRQ